MIERPILFSGPMVRALLDGRKTQTRRIVKPRVVAGALPYFDNMRGVHCDGDDQPTRCPYGVVGDRLWVRETWAANLEPGYGKDYRDPDGDLCSVAYAANGTPETDTFKCWRPSIFMPRWASRITLEVTQIRTEKLQEISEADAIAEGVTGAVMGDPWSDYRALWDSINGKRKGCSWAANPWVWVVGLRGAAA